METEMGELIAPVKVTSAHVRAALRVRYPAASYALMFEVGNGTGHNTSRHADAVAMGLWPSRGLEVEGVEIKVSRQDWLNELKNPEKAEAVAKFCDRWWIAAPKGMVKPDELPMTWGLLELDGDTLRQKVAAPKLDAVPLTRTFLAAMLRRASDADHAEVDLLVQKKLLPLETQIREEAKRHASRRVEQAEDVLAKVEEVKAATGINLIGWTPADSIIAGIKFGMDHAGKYNGLWETAKAAEKLAASIRAAFPTSEVTNG
jgi:hypothetical protein